MTRVYLSIGSNIDRERNIRGGLEALERDFGPLMLSPVYESEAVGFEGEPFFNLVVGLDTELSVGELAARLHEIEVQHGRVRHERKFSSRTLDIDILTRGDAVGEFDGVKLPRDEILKHAFVLLPLADLAPDDRHPELGISYRQLCERKAFQGQRLWKVDFPVPAS